MTSHESFELIVQFDLRAATYGADGLCYRKNNIDGSTNGRDICGNSNGPELLQKNYSKLINYLLRTDEIAAKLFQEGNILTPQLEMIQNETNKNRKNELLLNIIQRGGMNVFDRFITALLETEQFCILRLLQEGIDFSLEHVKIIQENYVFLIENVDPMSGLLDQMFQLQSLTNRELEEIKTKEMNYKKNEELMSLLLRKSYDYYQHFIEALETTNQKHIVKELKLKNEACSPNSNFPTPFHNQSPHDRSNYDQCIGRLIGHMKRNFHTLPGDVQMHVSLKIMNIVCDSNEHGHMSFVRQTLRTCKTVNEELNRGIETYSRKEEKSEE